MTATRLFLGRERPPLDAAAARLVAAAAPAAGAPGPVDLRGVSVILPGGRAGRLLVEALARAAAPRGVLLPAILTPRRFLDTIAPAGERAPSDLERRIAWSRSVGEARAADLADLLGSADPGSLTSAAAAAARARLADRLDRLAIELAEEGIPIAEFARAGRGATDRERARLAAVGRLAARAGELLARSGRSVPFVGDSSSPPLPPPPRPAHPAPAGLSPWIALALADPRARTRAALARLGGDLAAWVHAPESESARFGPVGELLTATLDPIDLLPAIDDDAWRIADSALGQAALAVAAVAAEERAGRRPILCVLDPEVRPLLVAELERAGWPVHDAAGRPFGRTALGALLSALGAALEGADPTSLAALLRHPGVDAALSPRFAALAAALPPRERAPLLASLDRVRAERLPATLADLELDPAGRAIATAARELLAPLAGAPRPAAAWAETIEEAVDRIERERRGAGGIEARAREALDAALDDLAAVPDPLSGEIGGDAALRLLAGSLAGRSIPDRPGDDALELLGWLELPLDPAESVVVLGANEGFLPARDGAPDPLLTPRLRAELGLAGDAHRAARDAWAMRSIVGSGRRATWISGRRGAEGDPRHPSRFLLLAGGDSHLLAERVRRAVERSGDPLEPLPLLPEDGEPAPPLALPRPTPPATPIDSVSITALGLYLRCPYSFWLERVLRLRELHDRIDELDPLRFGDRVHAALEVLGDPALAGEEDPATIEAALLDSLATVMRRHHGTAPAAAVRIQRAQAEERLRALARSQAAEARAGWRVHATEVEIPDAAPNFAAGEHRFTLKGRIDRIDRHEGSGRARIVDYKTGEVIETPERAHRIGPKGAKRWKSLQLPLYRHLAPLLGIEGEVEVGFVLLPGDLASVGYVPSGFRDEDHDDAIACARDALLAIRAGVFWPPGDLRAPWDRLFAGELPGARERFARGAGENDSAGAGESGAGGG